VNLKKRKEKKYELIVTDKKIAVDLKKALLNIDSDIVVKIDKNGYDYNVKTSIQNVKSDLDYKNDIIRKVKAMYDEFRSKIYENKNTNLKLLENMIRKIVLESTNISSAIDSYVEKLNAFEKKSFEDDGYTIPSGVFEKSAGKSWIKIITTTLGGKGQKSVFCFIDPKTGDIYKPAGWNAPAKGVRGNVLDKNPPLTLRQLYR